MKRFLFLLILIAYSHLLSAQLTYGTTGLLHAPNAEMQKDGTVMMGGSFLNMEVTPPTWDYHTFNYYLNATIFPWFEMSFVSTAFRWRKADGSLTKFQNEDRHFAFRLRLVTEGKYWEYMPAIVAGTSDPYTTSYDGKVANSEGNGYFCRFYLAATKHLTFGKENVGVTLAYMYNNRTEYKLNGIAGGITYNPSFAPDLRVIADYDCKDVAVGASYLFFNHLEIMAEMQRLKYFSGGIAYKFYLKK